MSKIREALVRLGVTAFLTAIKAEIVEKDKMIADLQAEIERLNNANKLLREQDVAQKTWGQVFALIKDVEDKCVAKLIDQDKQVSGLQAEIRRLEGGWDRVHDLEDEKGKYLELIEQLRQALITDELLANEAIALTPDIEKRKILNDVNILRMTALAAYEKEKK